MSTEKKHTPTPWTLSGESIIKDDICIAVIETDGGYEAPGDEQEANAELIVLAVNSHAALVDALQTLINLHEGIDHGGNGIEPSDWDQARAVLALAEGKAEK